MNGVFLDTNVLIYMVTKDDERKRRVAREAVFHNQCRFTGINNLNEMNCVLARKVKMPASEIARVLSGVARRVQIAAFGLATMQAALRIMDRYKYSYFDSLVIATALECGFPIMYRGHATRTADRRFA